MTAAVFTISGWDSAVPQASALTRRGRTVLGLLAALVVCLAAAVLWAGGGDVAAAQSGGSSSLPRIHTVVAGDTLWEIASELDPGADPRPMIDQIQAVNGLAGSGLRVGQELRLPAEPNAAG